MAPHSVRGIFRTWNTFSMIGLSNCDARLQVRNRMVCTILAIFVLIHTAISLLSFKVKLALSHSCLLFLRWGFRSSHGIELSRDQQFKTWRFFSGEDIKIFLYAGAMTWGLMERSIYVVTYRVNRCKKLVECFPNFFSILWYCFFQGQSPDFSLLSVATSLS